MADGFRLDVTELQDLAADLAAAAGLAAPIAVGVQAKYGRLVVRDAKKYVRAKAWKTGALYRSIQISPSGEAGALGLVGIAIEADTSTETGRNYAGYVEFGTRFMAPRPFMRTALRKHAKAYRAELVDAAAKLVGTKGGAKRAISGQSVYRGGSSFSLGKALDRLG